MFTKKKLFWLCLPVFLFMVYVGFWHKAMQRFSSEIAEIFTQLGPDFDKACIQKTNNPFLYQIRVKNPHITLNHFDAKTEGSLLLKLSPFTKKLQISIDDQKTSVALFGAPFCEFTGNIAYEIHDIKCFNQIMEKVWSIPEVQLPKYLRYLLLFNDMSLTFKDLTVYGLKKTGPHQEVFKWGYFHLDSRQLGDKFQYEFSTKNVLLDMQNIAALFVPSVAENISESELETLIYSDYAQGEYRLELPNKEGVISANIYTKLSEAELENIKTSSSSQIVYSIDPVGKLAINCDTNYQQKSKSYTKDKMLKMFRSRLGLKKQELAFATVLKNSDHLQKCFEMMLEPLEKFADNGTDSLSMSYSCSNINQILHLDTEYSFDINSWKMTRAGKALSFMAKTHWSAKLDDFSYDCELAFDQFNESLKAVLDYTPIFISSIMSMQYTTMLPTIPFTDEFYDRLNLTLRAFAKHIENDQVIFSIKGKNKEVECIGPFDADKFALEMNQLVEQLNPEIEAYSQKLQDACQDHIKI